MAKFWEENEVYKFNPENLDKKLYTLEMFSYPSGAQLHAGHWFNYGQQIHGQDLRECKGIMYSSQWASMLLVYLLKIML